ncbi:hypothetical protein ACEUAW_10075 [Aeromonas veronii]
MIVSLFPVNAIWVNSYLKIRTKLNHFALRAKLYLKATRIAFDELRVLRASA